MKAGEKKTITINQAEYAAIRQAANKGAERTLNRYETDLLDQLLRKIDAA
jgi:hypothetical protein